MAETISKRNLSQIQPVQTKRQEIEDKKAIKPGRKPISSEPKNKRTAQNRAAQRAFRERKEKKMKELEDRVGELENEKKAAYTESEFLRMQVEMLSSELAKYKGSEFDISSLKLEKKLLENYRKQSSNNNDSSSSTSVSDTHTLASDNSTPATTQSKHTFEFPWSNLKANINNTKNSMSYSESSNSYKGESSLSPGSDVASSIDSPSENNSNNINRNQSKLGTNDSKATPSSEASGYDFDKGFDEQVFCNNLGLACGTKDRPVPQFPNKSSLVDSYEQKSSLNDNYNNNNNSADIDKHGFGINSEQRYAHSLIDNNTENNNNTEMNDFLSLFNNNIDSSYDPNLAFNFGETNSKLLDDLDFLKDPSSKTYREDGNNNLELFEDSNNNDDELDLNNLDILNQITTDKLSYDPFEMNSNGSLLKYPMSKNVNNRENTAMYNDTVPSLSPASQSATSSSMSKYINSSGESPIGYLNTGYNSISRHNSKSENSLSSNTPLTPSGLVGTNNISGDDSNVVVPAKEERLVKCSEIWERVTAHPKYTDLDIDGLCSELRSKAKCSDKGAVVKSEDLDNILSKAY